MTTQFKATDFTMKKVDTEQEPPSKTQVFDPFAAKIEIAKSKEQAMNEELMAKDPTKLAKPEELGPIKAWSFSALKSFEECQYRSYLKGVVKVKEESSIAGARGQKIHDLAEHFVRGDIEKMPKELNKFATKFERLKQRFQSQSEEFPITLEENWGFTSQWSPTGWVGKETWCRQKLDAFVTDSTTGATVIDYKTGRKFGNELKHGEQGLHYAIGSFMRYPHLDFVRTEFWYLDKGEELVKNYTRERALLHLPKIHQRGIIMTATTEFHPNPSKNNCRWCSYAANKQCDFAHED